MRILAVLAVLPTVSAADTCRDELADILGADLTANGPYIATNTNQVNGIQQVYRQLFLTDTHYLVETLQPEGLPDTLTYDGGAWQRDGTGGWELIRRFDIDETVDGVAAQRAALADGVASASCEGDVIEGVVGETRWFGPELHVRYVLHPETRSVQEFTFDFTVNGAEILAHFVIEAAPGLELPAPSDR